MAKIDLLTMNADELAAEHCRSPNMSLAHLRDRIVNAAREGVRHGL